MMLQHNLLSEPGQKIVAATVLHEIYRQPQLLPHQNPYFTVLLHLAVSVINELNVIFVIS